MFLEISNMKDVNKHHSAKAFCFQISLGNAGLNNVKATSLLRFSPSHHSAYVHREAARKFYSVLQTSRILDPLHLAGLVFSMTHFMEICPK